MGSALTGANTPYGYKAQYNGVYSRPTAMTSPSQSQSIGDMLALVSNRRRYRMSKQIAEIERQLKELDQRRKVLVGLLEGYRRLGELDANRKGPGRDTTSKGSLSLRSAVLRVLTDAGGEPLKPKEIWEKAQILGAASAAKNPVAVSDLMAYQLQATRPGLVKTDGAWRLEPEGRSEVSEAPEG
jgi:hypothetical protein